MKTITEAFLPYIGTREYNGIVAEIQRWYYGGLVKASWCATSVSYFANEIGILDQLGGKNENVYQMMKATEKAQKKTGKGSFYYRDKIPKGMILQPGTIVFMLTSSPPMTETSSKHVTTVYQGFTWKGSGSWKALGGNQSDQIKVSTYAQANIYAIFVPDYGTEEKHPTLRRGDKGEAVKELQADLNRQGYRDAAGRELELDGSYGPRTEAAVINMQMDQMLVADGICGPITWARLDELMAQVRTVKVVTDLNCRMGPGKDFPIKTIVWEGEIYLVAREEDGWAYLPSPDGWVSTSYIETI